MITSETTAMVNNWVRLTSLLVGIICRHEYLEFHLTVINFGPMLHNLENATTDLLTFDNLDLRLRRNIIVSDL